MALLHYENLDIHRPDIVIRQAFFGLKPFYDFLNGAKRHLESDAAVKRVGWEHAPPAASERVEEKSGFWVRLVAPPGQGSEAEATFRQFLDDNVSEVYEAGTAVDSEQVEGNRFKRERGITVLDRDTDGERLCLDRKPMQDSQLLLRPNTYALFRQLQALKALQDAPSQAQRPLLRLSEEADHAEWPHVWRYPINDWKLLTDETRPGTDEQRRFVSIAMATPDFAFLEGPPGSGKTTAICELILQLVDDGKRVLLCASTHVAVDNVLERLMDESNTYRDHIIPVRIGDGHNVSEKASPWQLKRFVQTERHRLRRELSKVQGPTDSQKALLKAVSGESGTVERMVLDAANLVCGTTIGILQHPDIKQSTQGMSGSFDVLIVDEASKTTFQEFLVPALYAKRWVIVGDPRQLSPYVDDEELAVNVETCLKERSVRDACIDVFMASKDAGRKSRVTVVATNAEKTVNAYIAQAQARGVELVKAGGSGPLWQAGVVIGDEDQLHARLDELPLDVTTVRAPERQLDTLHRRAAAYRSLSKGGDQDRPEWAPEIAWRMARAYELRFTESSADDEGGRRTARERLDDAINALLPAEETEQCRTEIHKVRRVALPSVLESLQHGFERDPRTRKGTALTDGLPDSAMHQRHVLLSNQHRMHPEIAAFSHKHVYGGEALETVPDMAQRRAWGFTGYARRAVWCHVRGGFRDGTNANASEARAVVEELEKFDAWARVNPRPDGTPWEVAVLSFYRGQERELRQHLRRWSKNHAGYRHFKLESNGRPYLTLELCTVDRFQGHEADLVIISFANRHPTSFLESPNRLNVALTRARYQRVIVGDRHAMARSGGLLGTLAKNEPWEQSLKTQGGQEND